MICLNLTIFRPKLLNFTILKQMVCPNVTIFPKFNMICLNLTIFRPNLLNVTILKQIIIFMKSYTFPTFKIERGS